jgi:hypothetical protein
VKKFVRIVRLFGLSALAVTGAAQAATTWHLNDVIYSDPERPAVAPEQAVGWFTYDEASNTITDWSLLVKTVGSSTANFTYDKSRMTVTPSVRDGFVGFDAKTFDAAMYNLVFRFSGTLATAGDTLALTSGVINHGWRGPTSLLVSGSISTSPVPEIDTGVAFAMGLLGLVAVARRRQQSHQQQDRAPRVLPVQAGRVAEGIAADTPCG